MQLDAFCPLEPEVAAAMLDLAEPKPGEKYADLGCGNGVFLIDARKRGLVVTGYDISAASIAKIPDVAETRESAILNGDCFNADMSKFDIVTFWFCEMPGTRLLMDKLYAEMKKGSRLVYCFDSWSHTQGVIDHPWKPTRGGVVLNNRFWRCDK